MTGDIMLYAGSIIIILWGIAHIIATKSVVNGFGTISDDNRRIITMEWVAEGLTLCFIGLLVLIITVSGWSQNAVAIRVYRISASMLIVMAGWTLFTGARTAIIPIKICPIVTAVVATLFFLAVYY